MKVRYLYELDEDKDNREPTIELDDELAAAHSYVATLEERLVLYKQKSDKGVEEILKLRGELLKAEADVAHWFNEFQAEKTSAHKKVKELEEALQWYAEKGNMEMFIGTSEHHSNGEHWFNCWMMSPVTNVARKALGMKTETEELLNGRSNDSR